MTHAPGPWTFHAPIPGQAIHHYVVHNHDSDVAEVYAWDAAEGQANAAHIVAAVNERPQLLARVAELEEAREEALMALLALREADTPEEVQAAREQANAVIAKAQSA